MRFFIDSGDIDAIKAATDTGLIDGVTTNPSLVRKVGKDPDELYQDIIDLGIKDVSMEVSGTERQMVNEGIRLRQKFGERATIKLPMTRDGLNACRELSKQLIHTNVTLIFNAAQALLAAKAGATYVSPFVGRIDDQGYAGTEVVRSIAELYRMHNIRTQVLAASIRSTQRVVRCIYSGAHIVTMPPHVFDAMYEHVLTDKGLEIFEADLKAMANNSETWL